MHDDRVSVLYPTDTIRLNGILRGAQSTIRCATSNLTYKDYMRISSTFLLVCDQMITSALKSLRLSQEIGFSTPTAAYYAEKNVGNFSDDMVLTLILIASIEKTISLYSEFKFADNVDFSSDKLLGQLKADLSFSDETPFSVEKSIGYLMPLGLDFAVQSFSTDKCLEVSEALLAIEHSIELVADKYCGDVLSNAEFISSARFSLAVFRKLNDIDDLTFGDIDNWDMETFDLINN